MKVLLRLLSYSAKYKYRIFLGVFLSFLVSIFNGASLTGMIPIFDSMGSGNDYKFQISMTKRDKAILAREQEKEKFSRIEKVEYGFARLKQKVNSYFEGLTAYEVVKTCIPVSYTHL
ncbi:MAG: ABC transporter ATP-binding protein, partial [Leptospiraceae bacterium]|nr:ABC transporter ATP-binding protein [Leptospiraceae bacterium]